MSKEEDVLKALREIKETGTVVTIKALEPKCLVDSLKK